MHKNDRSESFSHWEITLLHIKKKRDNITFRVEIKMVGSLMELSCRDLSQALSSV